MNRFGRRSLILTTSAFATLPAPAIHAQSRGALRVGLGPQQPTQADTRRVWEPLYRLVAERLGLSLTLNVANDWAGISVALQNEQIDIAQMGPWGYILAHHKDFIKPETYPANLRFMGPDVLDSMLVFPKDMLVTNSPVNKLNNQVLVRFFDEEWSEYVH